MEKNLCSIIIGTGSYIPSEIIPNRNFRKNRFYDKDGNLIKYSGGDNKGKIKENEVIIREFEGTTGIKERRYAHSNEQTSDLAYLAAKNCLESSNSDPENLKYIVVAHNFGDINLDNRKTNQVPNLASRVKQKLQIKNRKIEAFDFLFGCPGWLQGMIIIDKLLNKGERGIVIGAEILSRVADQHDRDSMLYADGAGASLVEKIETKAYKPIGILSDSVAVDCGDSSCINVMRMDNSYNSNANNELFFKMDRGHDVFKYALKNVPRIIKESLDKTGLELKDIKKIILHQANEKMDEKIVSSLFNLYGLIPSEKEIKKIMPMTISWLGNSSVATIPTLFDLLLKGKINNHNLDSGDNILFASIGAGGPNINSFIYRMP